MFDPDSESLRQIAEIERRVRNTVGKTVPFAHAIITESDLDTLIALARAAVETPEGR